MIHMIRITVFRASGEYRGFTCAGHAEYAQEGSDIICAAVSALTVSTVNSVERFTSDRFHTSVSEGFLEFRLDNGCSRETALLMDAMILGLEDIQKTYGNEYIGLMYKEE